MPMRFPGAFLALLLAATACQDVPLNPAARLASPGGVVFDQSTDEWDHVLADTTVQGDVVVPDGQRWLIGPGVRVRGNVRTVNGTVALRPGSSLTFVGGDRRKYVGGGMHFEPRFANDFGLWIGGHGATGTLDISCTPKRSWKHTGSDATWAAGDEYWIAPTAAGDYAPRRWYPGQPIPRIHPRVPPAEVMNVSRDCVIRGEPTGHIHIHSTRPSRIEFVRLEGLGVIIPKLEDSGRYALHLHMMGDGSRGMVVRGVAAINSRGRVFVPHTSHGVTMIGNVSVNSQGEGFWWDAGDRTHDLLVDRLAVSGVFIPREVTGKTNRPNGVELGFGTNMTMKNSAVSGVRDNKLSVGFNWANGGVDLWNFSEGNVAHNNTGPGLRFWTNSRRPHLVENYISYRNKNGGIENGAYSNAIRYRSSLLVEDNISHLTTSKASTDGLGSFYERVEVYARSGPALVIGPLAQPGDTSVRWIDCVLQAGPGAPRVQIRSDAKNAFVARFIRCGITPDDIRFPTPIPRKLRGTRIIIEDESGPRWDISVEHRPHMRLVVRELGSTGATVAEWRDEDIDLVERVEP